MSLVGTSGIAHAYSVALPANPETLAEPRPLFGDGIPRGLPYFSPSGRAIAYTSYETGKPEIFVSKWSEGAVVGRPLLVSVGGGTFAHWSGDGTRLYYQTPREKVMAVSITESPELRASAPSEVWDLGALRVARGDLGGIITILPDGRLLAVQRPEGEGNPTQVSVVLDFPEELKVRMRAAEK